MDDNTVEREDTEVVASRAPAEMSIRETLRKQLGNENSDVEDTEPAEESQDNTEEEATSTETTAVVDTPPLAAPADMNAAEREAFYNPTQANAHILQQYLNRRAYETRTLHEKKMSEVDQLKRQTQAVYDAYQKYENDYAKTGISVADVTRRAIEWDKSMREDPVTTALDWLDSYGITPDELLQVASQQPMEQQRYLTAEEAQRIAEEKYAAMQAEQEQKALAHYHQQVVQYFKNSKPLFRDPETSSQLEAEMAPVVQALYNTGRYTSPQDVLETAYNYVVNGNPTFSALNSKIAAAPVIQQQQATVQRAKQAAKSISGSAGSGTPKVQIKDIRDNLARRFNGE